MEKIMKYLEICILGAKHYGEPLDDADWNKRVGVLLTVKEAEQILRALKELEELKKQ